MKLKFRADKKDVVAFLVYCVFLLYLVAFAVLNLNSFATTGYFYGLSPWEAFGPEFFGSTIIFYILAVVASLLATSSHFFERESGIGFVFGKKPETGYAKWMTDKEMKKKPGIKEIKIDDETLDAAGIPIINNGKKAWVDDSENHTLIIGASGSGKSECAIKPMVKFLIRHNESMIITDPKGELYKDSAEEMKARGYKIIVLNFRDPLKGNTWNPFSYPYRLYKEGKTDKAKELLSDLGINIIVDAKSNGDPFWQQASADYFTGLSLGLFEDAPESQVNINSINLMSTIGEDKLIGNRNYLQEYFTAKGELSASYIAASAILNTAEVTKQGVLSTFKTKIRIFSSNDTLSEMLSKSDFDLRDIGKEKTAVFLMVHDEKTTYHALCTIFVKQCYESLIDVAQSNENLKLKNRTNFVLDEFANFPALKDVDSMITAARSRNIRFTFVIQNFAQLDNTYGEHIAETIKGNCGNIYYLITTELKALETMSKLCGDVKPPKAKEGQPQEPIRPLVSVSDLQTMKKFDVLVKRFMCQPFKTSQATNFNIIKNNGWGHDYGLATLEERTPGSVDVFNIKDFVNNKRKEQGLPDIPQGGGRPAGMMTGFNPFAQFNVNPNPNVALPENKTNNSVNPMNVADMDDFVKKLDEKIAELEAEEEAEKNAKKDTESKEKHDDVQTINSEKVKIEVPQKEEIPKEMPKETEQKEKIEKPKINVDVDSIIVDNNVNDDDFFDDFFDDN